MGIASNWGSTLCEGRQIEGIEVDIIAHEVSGGSIFVEGFRATIVNNHSFIGLSCRLKQP